MHEHVTLPVIPAEQEHKNVQFGFAVIEDGCEPPDEPDVWTSVYRLTLDEAAQVGVRYEEALDAIEEMHQRHAEGVEAGANDVRIGGYDLNYVAAKCVAEMVNLTPGGRFQLYLRALCDEHAKDAA